MPEASTLRQQQRTQVATGLVALAGGLVLIVAVAAFLVAFASPANQERTPSPQVNVGRIQTFVVGEPQFFTEGRFWLVRQTDDSFLALHATDPFRGCTVP